MCIILVSMCRIQHSSVSRSHRLPHGPRFRKDVPRESKDHATLLDGDSTAQESGVPRLQIGPSDKELFDMYK